MYFIAQKHKSQLNQLTAAFPFAHVHNEGTKTTLARSSPEHYVRY